MIKIKNQAAIELGKRGGSARSEAKSAAARNNGAQGGRPHRIELSQQNRGFILRLLDDNLSWLNKFPKDDPSCPKGTDSIGICETLINKINNNERIDLRKIDMIYIIQLLAKEIARHENANRKSSNEATSDQQIALGQSVGEQLHKLMGEPSLLRHYLNEGRNRYK